MHISSSKFRPTDVVLNVPMALAGRLYATGLTPAQMRAAIVMLSSTDMDGRFSILKPWLEEMTDLRIDNGTNLILPIAQSLIGGVHEDEIENWFENIDYHAGVRRKTAGIFSGELTATGSYCLQCVPGSMPIRVDEFRAYSSVPAILLRLRLGSWFHRNPVEKRVKLRLKDQDVYDIFGDYCKAARRKRSDGSFDITLGRLLNSVITPAAEQINGICDEFGIDVSTKRKTTGAVGRALDYIDVIATRLEKRVTIKDLARVKRHREKILRDR